MNTLDLARVARTLLLAKANDSEPLMVAEELYGRSPHRHIGDVMVMRAAVDSHGVASGTTGAELYSAGTVSAEFADAVRPLSVIGRLNTRKVPLGTPLGLISTRSTFDFVEERAPIPVTAPVTMSAIMPPRKVAGIIVISKELLRSSRAEETLQREMVAGVLEALDRRLLDPDSGATDGRPASITSTSDPLYSATGATTPADLDDLFLSMLATLSAAGSTLADAAWVMHTTNAAALATMRDANGGLAYPNMSINGGTIAGLQVLASGAAPTDGLTLVDGSQIFEADDGTTQIAATESALIDMDTAPEGNNRISIFQSDAVGLKVVRELNWVLRDPKFALYAVGFDLGTGSASTTG